MDKYRIDGHKLHYHVSRVNDWLNGKTIYPIYMEISPAGACNHRCTFCGLDFLEYQSRFLDAGILKKRLSEMGKLGLKSVMYAGEGEPFLHKNFAEIVKHTKKSGIEVAITTNAVLFKESTAEQILDTVEWIKVSINAGTAKTYSKIHGTKPADFDKVIKNMSSAVKIRRENGYKCILGMQMLLLPENHHEIVLLAGIAKSIGMDYLVVKPYSQHPQSKSRRYSKINYNDFIELSEKLEKLNAPEFTVIFRLKTMKKWDNAEKSYSKCIALPFWSYIDAGGHVWGCSVFLGDKRFLYGNIYDSSFQEIWKGQKRLKSLHWMQKKMDAGKCRINCRMDEINKYLSELKNPLVHVNFI